MHVPELYLNYDSDYDICMPTFGSSIFEGVVSTFLYNIKKVKVAHT